MEKWIRTRIVFHDHNVIELGTRRDHKSILRRGDCPCHPHAEAADARPIISPSNTPTYASTAVIWHDDLSPCCRTLTMIGAAGGAGEGRANASLRLKRVDDTPWISGQLSRMQQNLATPKPCGVQISRHITSTFGVLDSPAAHIARHLHAVIMRACTQASPIATSLEMLRQPAYRVMPRGLVE